MISQMDKVWEQFINLPCIGKAYYFYDTAPQITNNIENYYWLFSSSAQSVSALVAFLLTGVALSFSIMDQNVGRDSTLYEVNKNLKKKYYCWMTALVSVSGLAIVSSLASTCLNPSVLEIRGVVMWTGALTTIVSIIGSIMFIIAILSPDKYENEAKAELAKIEKQYRGQNGSPPQEALGSKFIFTFIEMERYLRETLRLLDLATAWEKNPNERDVKSFSEMIKVFTYNEILPRELREKLSAVNKFRNLLVHGHEDKVSLKLLEELETTFTALKYVLENEKLKRLK